MKINLYDTTGRWWEIANADSEVVAKLLIHWRTKDHRDSVQVYPIDPTTGDRTYCENNPIYLLCDHIVAYEVIGQEDDEE